VQLSVLLLSASDGSIVTVPLVRFTEKSLQRAVGGILSITVTVAGPEAELPLWSVTVSVTVLGPSSEQVNVEGVTSLDTIVQLSVLLLSTSAETIETELPTSATVIFLVITVGGVISETVMFAVQLDVLPEASPTVRVTALLAPRLLQLKVEGVTTLDTIAQLSVLLLSTSVATIVAEVPDNDTEASLQIATGGTLSVTVTEARQLDELPDASATVKVTELRPRFEQSKVLGVTVLETIAQLS